MANETEHPQSRFFSEHNYAVPFGRYQPGGDTGPPANEVLVGRKGQRAYFIDLLFRMGRRGAFLITGHRGIGKTSFVKHCLSVHRDEVFERFLNSNVGRATFWDRLGVMMIAFIVLVVLSMISQLLEVFTVRLAPQSPPEPSPLLWIVLIPLVLLCLYPMLFAREVLREILETRRDNRQPWIRIHSSTVASVLGVVILAPVLWVLPPFGSPAISLSRFLVSILFLYYWVHCLPLNASDFRIALLHRITGAIFATTFMIVPFIAIEPENEWNEVWLNFSLATLFLGFGGLLRSFLLRHIPSTSTILENTPVAPKPSRWYLLSAIFFIILSFLIFFSSRPQLRIVYFIMIAGIPLVAGSICYLISSRKAQQKSFGFQPQPRLVLLLKALFCVVLSLQLLHPVIVRGMGNLAPSKYSTFKVSSAFDVEFPKALREIGNTQTLFSSKADELAWIITLFFCLLSLYYLEYEWIVRPLLRARSRPDDQPAPWEDYVPGQSVNSGFRNLARVTMPWVLLKTWLPILTVSVNLGFEKLEHRRVVHAMLSGLREQYHKTFLSWGSWLANLSRILFLLAVLTLANLIGHHWFELPTVTLDQAFYLRATDYTDICMFFRGAQAGASAVNIICKLPGGDKLVKILYFNLLESRLTANHDGKHLLFDLLLPFRQTPWPEPPAFVAEPETTPLWMQTALGSTSALFSDPKAGNYFLTRGIHFEIYHVLLFLFLLILARWLLGRLPILPYQETVRRIDEVLDFLSARTSVTSRTNRWEPVQVLQGWLMDERTRQTEQDPADPRTVEFLFLQILEDIQSTSFHLGAARDQLISLPTPEVTFVFDELDKLGTRVDPNEREAGGGPQQAEILHAERKRSMELHKLLADMKNLLSSAPARFIFVGGRNLHDEWFADQSARQPLLTNIFNAEVYLPSLVTDLGRLESQQLRLDRNIRIYLELQFRRAKKIFAETRRKQILPSFALPIEEDWQELFSPEEVNLAGSFELHFSDSKLTEHAPDKTLSDLLFRDFHQFLTYRSMGNPKRLKELLGTFVRPVERAVKAVDLRWSESFRDCDHVLAFGDIERFRIQLLARIYRHLTLSFEHRLVRRDDKLAISVFFLADFLFKFHRRAFSWSNLERVDELVHIHRAPDLREILESMVNHWLERFLHPIRNGMYDFRFRSDLAREVEYISRQSHEEMAAFNFTLDESQALKSAYSTNIAFLKERIGREPIDMMAGLGELHEFDQEYEEARVYYRRAVAILDERLREVSGEVKFADDTGPQDDADSSPVFAAFAATPRGTRLNRHFLTWGIARLRLMLQIGVTFEMARNFERAGIEYRNAHTLASALRTAMLNEQATGAKPADEGDNMLHSLKHLNILFQSIFAEAWISEKLSGAVDTGIGLIERELWILRTQLPFVRDLEMKVAENPVGVRSSNFSLIIAELHNKAGDLYFFKGRQKVVIDGQEMAEIPKGQTRYGHEGYLLRAHYHYAVALHELRRLISYRRISSPNKLNIRLQDQETWETIDRENWQDFLYRSAGGSINDLAEAMLGRVSLYGLLQSAQGKAETTALANPDQIKKVNATLADDFIGWMESPLDKKEISLNLDDQPVDAKTLQSWLGRWTTRTAVVPGEEYFPLIEFESTDHHDDLTRLLVSLQLKLVGIKLLENGGYREDSAHELMGICEVAIHFLWWILAVRRLQEWIKSAASQKGRKLLYSKMETTCEAQLRLVERAANASVAGEKCWSYLAELALYALKKANLLFQLSRRAEDKLPGTYLVGDKIPVTQLMLTCSLGLASENWEFGGKLKGDVSKLLKSWGAMATDHDANRQTLRKLLEDTLLRHSYPMVNRLHRLKLLIDDSLLSSDELDSRWESWVKELDKLTDDMAAPMHFTPLHSGTTYALAYLRNRLTKGGEQAPVEWIRRAAQRDLATSEEMFTLRRAYYENISDLIYLYDDFNDRQLHLNHGIQMAGAELNALLKFFVTIENDPEMIDSEHDEGQLKLPL